MFTEFTIYPHQDHIWISTQTVLSGVISKDNATAPTDNLKLASELTLAQLVRFFWWNLPTYVLVMDFGTSIRIYG